MLVSSFFVYIGQLPAAAPAGVEGAEQGRVVSRAAVTRGAERRPPEDSGGFCSLAS